MAAVSTLAGPLVWASELAGTPEKFTLNLDKQACDEIKTALAKFKGDKDNKGNKVDEDNKDNKVDEDDEVNNDPDLEGITAETFPLPGLKDRLTEARIQLHEGKGFVIVTGLDLDSPSAKDWAIVHLGISSHIGDKLAVQTNGGQVMAHVTSDKRWKVAPEGRHGIHSKNSLPFHNDMGGDILALQARDSAKTGGDTYLVSAATIHNDLATNHREALDALLRSDWPIQTTGDNKYITAPLMQMHGGKLVTSVDPARLGPHPKSKVPEGEKGVPKLTPDQVDALKVLDRTAKKYEIAVALQKGDMLFLNNWAILHRRDAYEDSEDTARHLVRLWIRNTELGWEIPGSMDTPWKHAFESVVEKVYNTKSDKKYDEPKFTAGSAAFAIDRI